MEFSYSLINSSEFKRQTSSFWNNYNLGIQWIRKHELALSKSKYKLMKYENQILHNYIRNLHGQLRIKRRLTSPTNNIRTRKISKLEYQETQMDCDEESEHFDGKDEPNVVNNNESLTFEVDDGMLEFLKISMAHKKEMAEKRRKQAEEKEKEPTSTSSDTDGVISEQLKKTSICEEAKELYGEASEKIMSMETATQLNFERNVKRHDPMYWPCIPINL